MGERGERHRHRRHQLVHAGQPDLVVAPATRVTGVAEQVQQPFDRHLGADLDLGLPPTRTAPTWLPARSVQQPGRAVRRTSTAPVAASATASSRGSSASSSVPILTEAQAVHGRLGLLLGGRVDRPGERGQPELACPIPALAVVVLLQQRQDRRPPDPLEPGLAVDRVVFIRYEGRWRSPASSIRALSSSSRSAGARRHALAPAASARSRPGWDRARGSNATKAKRRRIAASTRAMERSAVFIVPIRKRFVGSVNRSSSGEYMQRRRLVAVLEQEVQLAEDLGQVAAVDLVDDQHVRLGRVVPGARRPVGATARARSSKPTLAARPRPGRNPSKKSS